VELVVGATGYIGRLVCQTLAAERRAVRALSRNPANLPADFVGESAQGDVVHDIGLDEALTGCDAAYYLVHSMEPGDGSFEERDRRAAQNFVAACQRTGVRKVVYLGGIATVGDDSQHMNSRLEVEEILLAGLPEATGLRASIVIGAGSASFRLMTRLVERMPVLPMPPWTAKQTQPIAERDVIACLTRSPLLPEVAGQAIDVCGPDVLTYGEMLTTIADALLIARPGLKLPVSLTAVAAPIAAAVSGTETELVAALMGSLVADVLPRSPTASQEMAQTYDIQPLRYARAVSMALREWERDEPLRAR
jgi:uncharacterized protein YbjT (DUF2867 family)